MESPDEDYLFILFYFFHPLVKFWRASTEGKAKVESKNVLSCNNT